MKFIYLLLIPFLLFSQTGDIETQDFEGSGIPVGWSDIAGSPNYDYTTDPLEKLQSLELNLNGERSQYAFGADSSGEFYGFFIFRYGTATPGTHTFIQLYNDGTNKASILIRDGTRLQLNLAGGNGLGTADLIIDTKYYLWFYYKRSTGADGIFKAWRGTSPNKPEIADVNLTIHTVTDTIDAVQFWSVTNTLDIIVDYIVFSTSEIGDFIESQESLYLYYDIYNGYNKY